MILPGMKELNTPMSPKYSPGDLIAVKQMVPYRHSNPVMWDSVIDPGSNAVDTRRHVARPGEQAVLLVLEHRWNYINVLCSKGIGWIGENFVELVQ